MKVGATCVAVIAPLAVFAFEALATSQAEPPRPVSSEAACDLPDISPAVRPRLRCGTVRVPRDHGNLDASRFALGVVVIRGARQPALPDPLVYISGGPGSPLIVYTNYQATHPFAPGRDLILVDQRGTGRSEPAICPDLASDMIDAGIAVARAPPPETRSSRRAAYAACRDQAIAEGIDLRDFGTSVTVEDFNWVRQALGVKQWNVFGVSYGTTVAMTLMARYPDTIRSAVLDSVYPPDPILPPLSRNVADARNAFLASCDTNEACAAAWPDLAGTFQETVRHLEQQPIPMTVPSGAVPSGMHVLGNQVPLTAPLFAFVVARLIYYPNFYPGLPRLIAAVHDGDTKIFASSMVPLLAALTDPRTGTNIAAETAVQCRDRPDFHKPLGTGADVFEQLSLENICDSWSELGPAPVIPLDTEVPTLVLAGQFDPNARPADSRHVAALIGGHARWVEFPLTGHSVRAFSPCAFRTVSDFVSHPTQALETSCADQPPPIQFLPGNQTP